MVDFLKFIFAWWDTPLYLWSFKTLIGLFILIFLINIPIFFIYEVFIDEE